MERSGSPTPPPGVSSLPVPEGDFPFVLSGPKTQVII